MGSVFGNLTHSAVVSPDGTLQWQASPAAAAKTLASQQSKQLQPSTMDQSGNDVSAPTNFSRIVKPSYQQAADTGPAGIPNATSPGLTKGGKLATLLMSGLQGALAGRAASEQAVIQSGGRRSGGAGMGFQAGYQLPFTRAMMPLQLQQQQAETGLAQAGLTPVPLPGGVTLPAAIAPKFLSPYLGYQGKVDSAQIGAQGRTQAAQIGGQSRTQAAQIGGDARVRAAQLELGPMADVPQDLQQQYGLPAQLPLKMLNTAESAANRPLTTVAGADDTFVVNKQTNAKTPLGIGSPRIAAINEGTIEVADPDHPGDTKIVSKGQAKQMGAAGVQSASVQVPRAAAKGEVPKNIGDTRVAFNTMLQHADLLRKAARALNNGDTRLLNQISNQAESQFGDPRLTDFRAIANAYNHEVTAVVSKGHITDSEVKEGGATMPDNANFATIDQVLSSYEGLAKSKMQQMDQQINRAKTNVNRQPAQSSGSAVDSLLKKHGF